MKRFLTNILIFSIPIFIFILSIIYSDFSEKKIAETLHNHVYEELNNYAWVSKAKKVSGFILGASTLRYGLSSHLLSNTDSIWINFSMDARDPIISFFLLEKYYKIQKPKIKKLKPISLNF
jgi:hypothetical protein